MSPQPVTEGTGEGLGLRSIVPRSTLYGKRNYRGTFPELLGIVGPGGPYPVPGTVQVGPLVDPSASLGYVSVRIKASPLPTARGANLRRVH